MRASVPLPDIEVVFGNLGFVRFRHYIDPNPAAHWWLHPASLLLMRLVSAGGYVQGKYRRAEHHELLALCEAGLAKEDRNRSVKQLRELAWHELAALGVTPPKGEPAPCK